MRKSLIVVIWFLTGSLSYINGQELKVKNFQENITDISARENQVLDINSDPCALVKIYTGLTDLVIDGNRGVEKTEVIPGAVWVWVPEGTRQLKISRTGMPMFIYSLPVELKMSTVYSFDLESDQVFSIIINTGSVSANVIMGDSIYKTNTTIPGLMEGKYPIRIQQLGYLPVEDTLEVNESSLYFTFSLERTQQAVLNINSQPTGAVVLIDGEHIGATNFSGFRFPGEYRLQITLTNYIPVDTTIFFDPSINNTYDFELIKNTGWFKPLVFPSNSDISIDGSNVVPGIKELSAGSGHSISVSKYRYRTINEPFSLQRGDTLEMTISLEPEQGELSFIIEPDDAEIKMAKKEISLDIDKEFELKEWTGSTQMSMPVGNYELEAKRKGYIPMDTAFAIADAKTKYITLSMQAKKLSRGGAFAASLFFPGMGQFYSQRNIAGAAFITTSILGLGASGYFFYLSENNAKEYNELRADYLEELNLNVIITKREAMDAAYQKYVDAAKIRDICMVATAGIWFLNIVDATVFAKIYKPVLEGSVGNTSYKLIAAPGISSAGASFRISF